MKDLSWLEEISEAEGVGGETEGKREQELSYDFLPLNGLLEWELR